MSIQPFSAFLSFSFLLIFSELSGANFKRLAPILEAWDLSKKGLTEWHGGFEKIAVLCWALGSSIPILAFTVACISYLDDHYLVSNFVIGAGVGSNIVAMSLGFGIVMLSGPMSFFRIRTITSPIFLLLATLAFTFTCLNLQITKVESCLLLVLVLAYALYFRRFSSEWKYHERTHTHQSILDSTEGILPVLVVFCMGIGFFVLAVLAAYNGIHWLQQVANSQKITASHLAVHGISFLLALPWIMRIILTADQSDTGKSMIMTSLTHSCLLNILLIPGLLGLLWMPQLAAPILTLDIPILLVLTGVFVATLLIEKERGQMLTLILILFYFIYTAHGIL